MEYVRAPVDRDDAFRVLFGINRADFMREIAATMREEIRAEMDRPHLLKLDEKMTLQQVMEHLGYSKSYISELRKRRAMAKTQAEKDRAFAPEYGMDKALRFKRSEIDAWFESTQQD